MQKYFKLTEQLAEADDKIAELFLYGDPACDRVWKKFPVFLGSAIRCNRSSTAVRTSRVRQSMRPASVPQVEVVPAAALLVWYFKEALW
jgi:hypothetical protein